MRKGVTYYFVQHLMKHKLIWELRHIYSDYAAQELAAKGIIKGEEIP